MFFDTETKSKSAYFVSGDKLLDCDRPDYLFADDSKSGEKLRMKIAWTLSSRYDRRAGFNSDRWNFWTNTEQIWRYIISLTHTGSPLCVISHNVFFDLQCSDFFYYLTKWGWSLDYVYDKGFIYILVISKGGRVIKCLSSTNFFPFSLERLGVMIGVPKGKVDFKTVKRSELIAYCKRDVLILRKAMEYYLDLLVSHDLGTFKLTRASQAFNSFRYRFMDRKVWMHKHEEVTALEQSGYFGGRVESRFLGKCKGGSFHHLDVNSLYPFVMKTNFVPVKLIDHGSSIGNTDMAALLKNYCCIAQCSLQTDEPAYACRHKGKVVFPVGSFDTTLCSEGLRYALKHGHLKQIGLYSVYERDRLFTSYVNYWYDLRKKYDSSGNAVMKELTKNFLNYLYGKFAQKNDITEMVDDMTYSGYWREEVFDLVTRDTEITTKMFNRVFRTFGKEPSNIYFVAIAAHITEYARFVLWRLMKIAGPENILYCDTDSLKMRSEFLPLYKSKINPSRLGFLKIEDVTRQLSIFGAKHYTTEKVTKIKGVPAKAKNIGGNKYVYDQFFRQVKHLRAKITRFVVVKKVTKTVKPFYDKGEVHEDGTIEPFMFWFP